MPKRKTLVMFTIDTEAKLYADNGFWSATVNGVMPGDLDALVANGIVTKGPYGWIVDRKMLPRLAELRGEAFARFDPAKFDAKAALAAREGGLPQIFRSLDKFGFKATCFVDFAGLYTFGAQEFGASMAMIDGAGHDPQVHLHMEAGIYTAKWFREMGLERPTDMALEKWPVEILERVFARLADDYRRFCGRDPIAYRGGAYRISDTLLEALRRTGFKLDFSLDHLEKNVGKRHLSFPHQGNYPVEMFGLTEIPVTAFRVPARDGATGRFNVSHDYRGLRRAILSGGTDETPPVIVYILHSVSLMKLRDRGGANVPKAERLPEQKPVRIGEDPELVAIFEEELDLIARSPHLEVVTCPRLLEQLPRFTRELKSNRYFFQDIAENAGEGARPSRIPAIKVRRCNVCGASALFGASKDGRCRRCGSTPQARSERRLRDALKANGAGENETIKVFPVLDGNLNSDRDNLAAANVASDVFRFADPLTKQVFTWLVCDMPSSTAH